MAQNTADESDFMNMPQTADLDFQLIWPDSEELFQSLMSADSASHVPLGTLPLSSSFDHNLSANIFNDPSSTTDTIPSGEGHAVVNGVSKMITNLVWPHDQGAHS